MPGPGDLFESALAAEGVTGQLADVARSIYAQESGSGKNTKTSNAGAVGGMQIIPGTFKQVADKDWSIDDPMHNARAGIRYLAQMNKLAGGDPALTAAGYYGGPGGLAKAKQGIAVSDPRNPNAPNTLEYGAQVAARVTPKGGPTPRGEVPVVAAAPAQVLERAPSQVAAGGTPYTPLPYSPGGAEPVGGGPSMEVGPGGGGGPRGPDPWQAFLASIPNQQVRPEDLSFGPGQVPRFGGGGRGRASGGIAPNFSAFQGWKRRTV